MQKVIRTPCVERKRESKESNHKNEREYGRTDHQMKKRKAEGYQEGTTALVTSRPERCINLL